MSSNATLSVLRDKAPAPLLSADIASGLAIMVVAALAMSISPSLVRLADVGPFRQCLLARLPGLAGAVGVDAAR